jgi:hypothetical protein
MRTRFVTFSPSPGAATPSDVLDDERARYLEAAPQVWME